MLAPSGQIPPPWAWWENEAHHEDRSPARASRRGRRSTGSLGEEPHAELSNDLYGGLDDGVRGGQHVDHDPELPAAVVGAEGDTQEAGDAADVADQASGGRLGLQQSQAVAVIQGERMESGGTVMAGSISASSPGGSSRPPSRARKKPTRSSRSDTSAPAAQAQEGFWAVRSSSAPSSGSPCRPSGRL
jgi:hypothetical protein